MGSRLFIIGPNASGKSNLLDAFRFLRDLADEQGGLKTAVDRERDGFSRLRSLHATADPNLGIEVSVQLEDDGPEWRYVLELSGKKNAVEVHKEEVWCGKARVLQRPGEPDRKDPKRLGQTALEQVQANADFRQLAEFFASVEYIHLVPQFLRKPGRIRELKRDPFGSDFLEQVARTPNKKREARLKQLRSALAYALPQFESLDFERDSASGAPHLKVKLKHWRKQGSWQREDQFSDGTLRLVGMLWLLSEGGAPLLLEEPELSLHSAVVRQVPRMMARAVAKHGRQIIVTTHAGQLLADSGIDSNEILVLEATDKETKVCLASGILEAAHLASEDGSLADFLVAYTKPPEVGRLASFGS